mgnify:FL=1
MTLQEDGYEILESKINYSIKHDFDILDSMAKFKNSTFLDQIRHNLDFYEMSIKELSVSTRISEFRLNALLNGNARFENDEILLIKKRLHI